MKKLMPFLLVVCLAGTYNFVPAVDDVRIASLQEGDSLCIAIEWIAPIPSSRQYPISSYETRLIAGDTIATGSTMLTSDTLCIPSSPLDNMLYVHAAVASVDSVGQQSMFENSQDTLQVIISSLPPDPPSSVEAQTLDTNFFGGEILFEDGFESGDYSAWSGSEFCCDHSLTIVDDPTRAGDGAARFEIRRDDPLVYNGIRSEVKIQGNSITGGVGDERWYGFSILVPTTWIAETQLTEIIAQWHANSDEHLGEGGRSPPLYIEINGDLLRVRNRWDPAPVSPSPTTGSAVEWEGPLDKGVWVDWVFHVRWSYEADGLLEVWKNGTKIVDKHGPNTYNDVTWLYFKMGLYNWSWATDIPVTSRVIFHDEVRVAAG